MRHSLSIWWQGIAESQASSSNIIINVTSCTHVAVSKWNTSVLTGNKLLYIVHFLKQQLYYTMRQPLFEHTVNDTTQCLLTSGQSFIKQMLVASFMEQKKLYIKLYISLLQFGVKRSNHLGGIEKSVVNVYG